MNGKLFEFFARVFFSRIATKGKAFETLSLDDAADISAGIAASIAAGTRCFTGGGSAVTIRRVEIRLESWLHTNWCMRSSLLSIRQGVVIPPADSLRISRIVVEDGKGAFLLFCDLHLC